MFKFLKTALATLIFLFPLISFGKEYILPSGLVYIEKFFILPSGLKYLAHQIVPATVFSAFNPVIYVKAPAANCPKNDIISLQVCLAIEDYFPLEEEGLAKEIFNCESGLRNIQSQAKYKKDYPQWGIKAGDREQSFGIPQVHRPAHPQFNYERLQSNKLKDLIYGVEVGYLLWKEYGWENPWVNCLKRPHIQALKMP